MNKLIDVLSGQLQYDIEVMSQPWMYWCLMIPILLYVAFFFVKWTVLTAPFWLPFGFIVKAFRSASSTDEKKAV